jgi:hypothetical protein
MPATGAGVAPGRRNENPWSVETMKTKSKFTKQFDGTTSLDGREYIEAEIRPGLTIRVYAEFDEMTNIDDWGDDEFTPEEVAAWNADEWQFAITRASAWLNRVCIVRHLGSIGGIQHDEAGDGRALNEAAEELLSENEAAAIRACKEFAKAAAKATR